MYDYHINKNLPKCNIREDISYYVEFIKDIVWDTEGEVVTNKGEKKVVLDRFNANENEQFRADENRVILTILGHGIHPVLRLVELEHILIIDFFWSHGQYAEYYNTHNDTAK